MKAVLVYTNLVYTHYMEIRSSQFIKGIRGTDPILYDNVPQIAFVGRSNVGKSSVINRLCNKGGLAKTGKKPGKTTEINIFTINAGECYFVDLPGYGYAKVGPKEKEMLKQLIYWYVAESEVKALVIVVVLDTKVGLTRYDQEMIDLLQESGQHYIIAANKSDKLNQKELAAKLLEIREAAHGSTVIPCSTLTSNGISALSEELARI